MARLDLKNGIDDAVHVVRECMDTERWRDTAGVRSRMKESVSLAVQRQVFRQRCAALMTMVLAT